MHIGERSSITRLTSVPSQHPRGKSHQNHGAGAQSSGFRDTAAMVTNNHSTQFREADTGVSARAESSERSYYVSQPEVADHVTVAAPRDSSSA